MRLSKAVALPLLALPVAALLYACTDDRPSLACGEGTVQRGSLCVVASTDAGVVDSAPTEPVDAQTPIPDGGATDAVAPEPPDPVSPSGTVLAAFTDVTTPFFTRDGRTLVLGAAKDGVKAIWRYDTRTQQVTKLADRGTNVFALSRDEKYLFANSPDGMLRVAMDGSSSAVIFQGQAIDGAPSADGRSFFYATNVQLRRVPLVRDGSEGETIYSVTFYDRFTAAVFNENTTHAVVQVTGPNVSDPIRSVALVPGATPTRVSNDVWIPPAPRESMWGDYLLTGSGRLNIKTGELLRNQLSGKVRGDFLYGKSPTTGALCRSNMRTLDPLQCFDDAKGVWDFELATRGPYAAFKRGDQTMGRLNTDTGAVDELGVSEGLFFPRISPSGTHVTTYISQTSAVARFVGPTKTTVASPPMTGFSTVAGDEHRLVFGNVSTSATGTDSVTLSSEYPGAVLTFPSAVSEVVFTSMPNSGAYLRVIEP
jgi:hypothetical protein